MAIDFGPPELQLQQSKAPAWSKVCIPGWHEVDVDRDMLFGHRIWASHTKQSTKVYSDFCSVLNSYRNEDRCFSLPACMSQRGGVGTK